MKNREIIQYIDRYCVNNEELDTTCNADLAFAILAHGYLYVRPGEATERFESNILDVLKVGMCAGVDKYREYYFDPHSLDEWIRVCMAKEALVVAREAFNETYFKRQISCLDPDEECDESLLDKYLKLMDKEHLLDFLHMCTYYSQEYLVFSYGSVAIYKELHERCWEMDPSLPNEWYDYKRGRSLDEDDPYYMADYLSKEEIIDAIERTIVNNKSLAGHLARMFYISGDIDDMDPYISLIFSYEYTTRGDIYKPYINVDLL